MELDSLRGDSLDGGGGGGGGRPSSVGKRKERLVAPQLQHFLFRLIHLIWK